MRCRRHLPLQRSVSLGYKDGDKHESYRQRSQSFACSYRVLLRGLICCASKQKVKCHMRATFWSIVDDTSTTVSLGGDATRVSCTLLWHVDISRRCILIMNHRYMESEVSVSKQRLFNRRSDVSIVFKRVGYEKCFSAFEALPEGRFFFHIILCLLYKRQHIKRSIHTAYQHSIDPMNSPHIS